MVPGSGAPYAAAMIRSRGCRALALFALALSPAPAAAAGVADTVTVLPPIQVEGTRGVVPGRTTATTVRLDRSQLQRFLPLTAADALITAPGVDLIKTGPWASKVSVRGLSGDRVLVLVDGVRVNTVRGHGIQTSLISSDRLESVEILPGASSAQFGSDAMGGVVNFVTHRNLIEDTPAATLTLSARAAEPGQAWGQSGRLRLTGPRLGLEVAGGLGGLRELSTPAGRIRNSGDRENDFSGRVAARLGAAVLDLEHGHHAARDVGLPAFNSNAGSTASYPLQGRDVERLEIGVPGAGARPTARLLAVVQNFATDFTEATVDSTFRHQVIFVALKRNRAADRVRTHTAGAQPSFQFSGPGRLRLAGEYRRETTGGPRTTNQWTYDGSGALTGDTTIVGESVPPAWREVWSGSAYAAQPIRGTRFEAGLRWDELRSHADSTANSSTSRLDVTDRRVSAEGGASQALGAFEPYLHVASGFRAPNLEERYFNDDVHGGLHLFGNPDLRPEHSLSYEAGVRVGECLGGRLRAVRLSAFRSDVRDLITFHYIGQLYQIPRFQYVNVRRARVDGLEATTAWRVGGVAIGLNAAYPRAVDASTGKRLTDAGSARASLEVTVPIRRLLPLGTLSARVRWNDAVISSDTTIARRAFATTSLEAACVALKFRAVIAVRNLWNLSYREPLSFIPEPGRSLAFSLRRDFTLPVPFSRKEP